MPAYNEVSKNFFDECEAQIENNKKIMKISSLVATVAFAVFVIFGLISFATNEDIIGYITTFGFITCIASIIVTKKVNTKIKNQISEFEGKYFDDVYMWIVAEELDAKANSNSYINSSLKKSRVRTEDVIKSRDVEIAGFYKGCPYKLSTSTKTIVDDVVYNRRDTRVISYKPKIIDNVFNSNYSIRHNVAKEISIISPMMRGTIVDSFIEGNKKIKMDNKKFKFEVVCEDAVTAYKFLTADVMEEIMALDRFATVDGMFVSDQEMNVVTSKQIINLHYSPKFSRDMNKNRIKYSGESILAEATDTANKIKEFLSYSPAAMISH